MSTISKILVGILVLAIAAFGIAFLTSRYLVSRLDGTGKPPAQTSLLQYSSEEGITFLYPDSYSLSARSDSNGEKQWDVLLLLPKGYTASQGGEGPPAITVGVFPNPENLSLEAWVKTDARSNWALAEPNATPASTTVGGEEALSYQHSGLYEFDAVAVAHDGKIFVFEAGWMSADAPIRADFAKLLDTVQFN